MSEELPKIENLEPIVYKAPKGHETGASLHVYEVDANGKKTHIKKPENFDNVYLQSKSYDPNQRESGEPINVAVHPVVAEVGQAVRELDSNLTAQADELSGRLDQILPEVEQPPLAEGAATGLTEESPKQAVGAEAKAEVGEKTSGDIFDEFAEAARNGYDGSFKQWNKEKNQREEAEWLTFVRPAGESVLAGLDSIFTSRESLAKMLETEVGKETILDYLSSEKGKSRIIEAIQGTEVDIENRRNEVLNEKAGEPDPTDEDIFKYIMRIAGPKAPEEPEEPKAAEEPNKLEESEQQKKSEEPAKEPWPGEDPDGELDPSLTAPLIIEPGMESVDSSGNSGPGRFRKTWDRIRQGYISGTYKYITGENISAQEQGKDKKSRLTKRGLGALVLLGAGAGLAYLAYRGFDSGGGNSHSGGAHGVELLGPHQHTGVELPNNLAWHHNPEGGYSLTDNHGKTIIEHFTFNRQGDASETTKAALKAHDLVLHQDKLSYIVENGLKHTRHMTEIQNPK